MLVPFKYTGKCVSDIEIHKATDCTQILSYTLTPYDPVTAPATPRRFVVNLACRDSLALSGDCPANLDHNQSLFLHMSPFSESSSQFRCQLSVS